MLGKHVDATIAPYAVVREYIQAGQVRTLGTLLKEPPALLKDIPTAHDRAAPNSSSIRSMSASLPKGTTPQRSALNAP